MSLLTFVFSAGLGYQIRLWATGNADWKQWAGGLLSFEHIGPHSVVVLKDTFLESLTWDAINAQAPYFDTIMLGFLIIGVGSSLIPPGSQPSTFERK